MVDHLGKQNTNESNRNKNELDKLEKLEVQCQEIYQPPGVFKPKASGFDMPSKIDKEIRMAVPTEKLHRRVKMAEPAPKPKVTIV